MVFSARISHHSLKGPYIVIVSKLSDKKSVEKELR